MGNSKLKTDEEWSQENLGDDLFDSYEEEAVDESPVEVVPELDELDPEAENVLREVPAKPAVQAQEPEELKQVQEAALDVEPSDALLDLAFDETAVATADDNAGDMGLDLDAGMELEIADSANAIDSDFDGTPSQGDHANQLESCLLYTSPSPRDQRGSRMPSSA